MPSFEMPENYQYYSHLMGMLGKPFGILGKPYGYLGYALKMYKTKIGQVKQP
jgi:hypothetical protein